MSLGITAAGWTAIGTGALSLYSANQSANAAEEAAAIQGDAAQAGITEQRRQFDAIQKLLSPYVTAGTDALGQQQALIGASGPQAQQQAIDALRNSPQFTSLLKQGENSILANASATGGLRGGNTQAALAQFSPALLSQLINDQYTRLGGLTSLGQNAAAGVGTAGMNTGANVSNLLQQQGAAGAGGVLGEAKAGAISINELSRIAGGFAGGGQNFFAGGAPTGPTNAQLAQQYYF